MSRKVKIDLLRSFAPIHNEIYVHQSGLGNPIRFDVSKAWQIVDGWTPAQRKSRFEYRWLSISHLQEHSLNTAAALNCCLEIPTLWVTITEPSPITGQPYTWTWMIDGYHRAYKFFKTERGLNLPAFVLTPEESAACRIMPQTKKRRRVERGQ